MDFPVPPAETPRILWVELTSKCPFDCVFCSRKARRGSGEHMPYRLFEALLRQISQPRILRLNYSGESTVYPELIPAIRLARSSGAFVELVSALAAAPEPLLMALSQSGLNRLTVSIHAAREADYAGIYRYGSFAELQSRLKRFAELSHARHDAPLLDFAFVAMDRNLQELPPVAALARSLAVREISISPVIRRDEIPVRFPQELAVGGDYRAGFMQRVQTAVAAARQAFPEISFTVTNPAFKNAAPILGEVPAAYPGPLPAGARIYSCEQNPWETAHVLSNGDVVACEVLDQHPLGNLNRQSMAEIWHGEPYRLFRQRYRRGDIPECRSCPWKSAFQPGPMLPEIIGSRGRSPQLAHGWHESADEPHVWSSQQALAVIFPREKSHLLHVSGVLPPGPEGDPNRLSVSCNKNEIGTVINAGREPLRFEADFPLPEPAENPWFVEFHTRHVHRPSDRPPGTDQRDLGFALVLLASRRFVDPELAAHQRAALRPVIALIRRLDGVARILGRYFPRRRLHHATTRFAEGVSVIIPERGNAEELTLCLASVNEAARRLPEPVEVIVVVNGSRRSNYAALQASYPGVRWQFYKRALGFAEAVDAGLRHVRSDWVYLLNSDVVLAPDALAEAARHRQGAVFAVASQIVLKDATRFRDETNWTALFIEDGLATIHDLIPRGDAAVDGFYAGGGASLFQARLLRSLVDSTAYSPFYWEDVEWGWRAQKLGYRCIFCPGSIAHHTRRSTISRYYSAEEIDAVLQRNRLLFNLRNLTTSVSLDRVSEEVAQSPRSIARHFLGVRTIRGILGGRIWNYRAPVPDEALLDRANRR